MDSSRLDISHQLMPQIKELLEGPESLPVIALPPSETPFASITATALRTLATSTEAAIPDFYRTKLSRTIVVKLLSITPLGIGSAYSISYIASMALKGTSGLLEVRSKIQELTSEEQESLFKELNPVARAILKGDWDNVLNLLHLLAGLSSVPKRVADDMILNPLIGRVDTSITSTISTVESLLTTDSSLAGIPVIAGEFSSAASGMVSAPIRSSLTADLAQSFFLNTAGKFAIRRAEGVLDEALLQLDRTLVDLPPEKILAGVFTALAGFAKTTTGTTTPSALSALKLATEKRAFPSSEMNAAFERLFKTLGASQPLGEGLHAIITREQKEIGGSKQAIEDTEGLYAAYIRQHKLEGVPDSTKALFRAAIALKHSLESNEEPPSPGLLFLLDLVLLYPQKIQIACSGEVETAMESLLSIAGATYIKRTFYPTLKKVCFPDDLIHFLKGASKLSAQDLDDRLATELGRLVMDQGLKVLHDTHSLSVLLLKAMGVSTESFEEYQMGEGDEKSRIDGFAFLGTDKHTEAISALSKHKKTTKNLEQLAADATKTLDIEFKKYIDELPFLWRGAISTLEFVYGGDLRSVTKEMIDLTKRPDWGMFLILLSGDLQSRVENPKAASGIDEKILWDSQMPEIIQSLLPSLKAMNMKRFFGSYISKIKAKKYESYLPGLKNTLRMRTLQDHLMRCLKSYETVSIPEGTDQGLLRAGLSSALHQHVTESVLKIWGIASKHEQFEVCMASYIEFLLKQKPKELVEVLRKAATEPAKIRQQITREKKSEFKSLLEKATTLLDEIEKLNKEIADGSSVGLNTDRLKTLQNTVSQQGVKLDQQLRLSRDELRLLLTAELHISSKTILATEMQDKINILKLNLSGIDDQIQRFVLEKSTFEASFKGDKKEELEVLENLKDRIESLQTAREEIENTITLQESILADVDSFERKADREINYKDYYGQQFLLRLENLEQGVLSLTHKLLTAENREDFVLIQQQLASEQAKLDAFQSKMLDYKKAIIEHEEETSLRLGKTTPSSERIIQSLSAIFNKPVTEKDTKHRVDEGDKLLEQRLRFECCVGPDVPVTKVIGTIKESLKQIDDYDKDAKEFDERIQTRIEFITKAKRYSSVVLEEYQKLNRERTNLKQKLVKNQYFLEQLKHRKEAEELRHTIPQKEQELKEARGRVEEARIKRPQRKIEAEQKHVQSLEYELDLMRELLVRGEGADALFPGESIEDTESRLEDERRSAQVQIKNIGEELSKLVDTRKNTVNEIASQQQFIKDLKQVQAKTAPHLAKRQAQLQSLLIKWQSLVT